MIEKLEIRQGWWLAKLDNVDRIGIDATKYISVLPEGTTVGSSFVEGGENSSDVVGGFAEISRGVFQVNYSFTLDSLGYYMLTFGQYVRREKEAFNRNPIELSDECSNSWFDGIRSKSNG